MRPIDYTPMSIYRCIVFGLLLIMEHLNWPKNKASINAFYYVFAPMCHDSS